MTGKGKAVERLGVEEIDQAVRLWIFDSQKELLWEPKFKKTKENLDNVEQNGIYVCKVRLENSYLQVEAKYPIILPKNRFADLVVWECHKNVHHFYGWFYIGRIRN